MKDKGFTHSELITLDQTINQKKSYSLSDVLDKIEKVAFDVVRFKDDDLSKLWQIQKADDGTEIIVAMYDGPELKAESNWTAIPDKSANIQVFYKGEAIHKFAISSLGFDTVDTSIVCRTLKSSLDTDKEFVKALVNEIPVESREFVLNKYPELKGNK